MSELITTEQKEKIFHLVALCSGIMQFENIPNAISRELEKSYMDLIASFHLSLVDVALWSLDDLHKTGKVSHEQYEAQRSTLLEAKERHPNL